MEQQKKATWIENVINRTVEWKLSMDGLHYTVVGERTNHQDLILNPKYRRVVLFEGTRKGVYKPFEDVLRDIADTWAAEVLLGHGEAYRGENKVSGDKCETVLTYQKTGDKSEYIYFEQE